MYAGKFHYHPFLLTTMVDGWGAEKRGKKQEEEKDRGWIKQNKNNPLYTHCTAWHWQFQLVTFASQLNCFAPSR
jgi:hypothetical protein